jgi:hypothetical protein
VLLKQNLRCTERPMVWHRGPQRENWTKILLLPSRSGRDAIISHPKCEWEVGCTHRLGEWSMILKARQSAAAIVT